jgi:hypothetical protein
VIAACTAAICLSATPHLAAQTITHGDSTFTLPTTTTIGPAVRTGSTGGTSAVLIAGGDDTNQLFQHWWWFRVQGTDTREFALSTRTSNSAAGNLLTLNYAEFEGFTARVTYTLTDGPVPASCNVAAEVRISNLLGSPLQIALICYLDLDLEGAASDSAALLSPTRIQIADASGFFGQFLAIGPSTHEVDDFSQLRSRLSDTNIDNLSGGGLPFAAGNWTGGFQWNLTVPVGASQAVHAAFSVNMNADAGCASDVNADGLVNSQDYFDFLTSFFAADPAADFNEDGAINSQDYFDFLTAFFGGC